MPQPDPKSDPQPEPKPLDPALFRRRLMAWYRLHARILPWRGVTDPYCTWVSEIMLQQTRVTAVIDHYHAFLRRFPTLVALALAPEPDVLAAWSGLGYYRRARMLHKAAQFIVLERHGMLPRTAVELRTLPGIGLYTAAAIASIAFGESIAVVDGNVERVLLRLTGRPEDATAAGLAFIHAQADALVPPKRLSYPATQKSAAESDPGAPHLAPEMWASTGTSLGPPRELPRTNAAGDHNQAMMELGATICLPRAPLCLQCPVYTFCRTRGEHATPTRKAHRSQPIAYLLHLRKRGPVTDVLLTQRPPEATLMPGMYDLPPLPLDQIATLASPEPILRVRHGITNTNYYVSVYSPAAATVDVAGASNGDAKLTSAVPVSPQDLHWIRSSALPGIPLTGLARKILQRLKVMDIAAMEVPEES